MPIYEYRCDSCGERFEELVRTGDDEGLLACPKCGSKKAARQPSVFSARAAATPLPMRHPGGCGRCGDPSGPCGLD